MRICAWGRDCLITGLQPATKTSKNKRLCLGRQVVKTIERILYANDEAEAKQAMAEAQAQHAG